MVIFPISAIGMDISIHKCHHMGTIHIALFSKSNNSCICPVCKAKQTEESTQSSCCPKKEIVAKSCCASSEESSKRKSDEIKPITEQKLPIHKNLIVEDSDELCCMNSNISYAINTGFVPIENEKGFVVLPISLNDSFQKIDFIIKNFDKFTSKDINYPLKEPICNIISYIHFTFETGDDAYPSLHSLLS